MAGHPAQAQACRALADWLRHSPQYSGWAPHPPQVHLPHLRLAPNPPESFNLGTSFMSKELHEETTGAYIQVRVGPRPPAQAARQAGGGGIDPDIQAGLGVLFNLSGEYDKAVDCFRLSTEHCRRG